MNILIVADKFKGSLTTSQVGAAIRSGFEKTIPGVICRELPLADGGEGTAEILCGALAGEWVTAPAHDPLGETVDAGYAWLPDRVAVIGMSAASGLWRIPPERRDLLRASTFGTGELMEDAIKRGARKILLGLGGSATNDGGVGAAAALGYRFVDHRGQALEPCPHSFSKVRRIVRPARKFPEVVAMCDVENPLLGPRGATYTYGPQKGGDALTLSRLEESLAHLANIVALRGAGDFRETPGAGSAGGFGFGALSFFGARLCSGFEAVSEALGLPEAIASSDLVITGEGCMDRQTLEGKGPAGVALLARRCSKPVIAFAGHVRDSQAINALFDGVFVIKDEHMPLAVALRDAESLLESKAAEVAARSEFSAFGSLCCERTLSSVQTTGRST